MPFHHISFKMGMPHRTHNIYPHTLTSTIKKISEQFARYLDEISERSIQDEKQNNCLIIIPFHSNISIISIPGFISFIVKMEGQRFVPNP